MDVNQFWDALNALSEELLWSAEDKLRLKTEGKTLEIRIDETFANARFVRDILKALIRENRFTILPLTVQKLFADIVRQISETLTAGADDQDTIESLTQHVESAITLVWQYHLQSIPDDYLDYARKQESLKRVEEEFATARGAMVSALTTASSLGEAFARSKENEDALKLLLVSGNESVGKILEDVSKTTTVTADAESVLKKIKDANTEAGDFRSKADTAASDAKSANDSIQAFFKEISTYRIEMTAATAESRSAISEGKKAVKTFLETSSQTANDTIKEFNDNTEAAKVTRQTELDKLDTRMASKEANIDKQLLKAIGKSMFHSFDTRKKQIWVTKWIWVGIVIVLFGVSACYAYLLSSWLYTEKIVTILPAVYLRFSIALPLAGAIWFAIELNTQRNDVTKRNMHSARIFLLASCLIGMRLPSS